MLQKYENNINDNLNLTIYCINLDHRKDRWKLIEKEYIKFCLTIYRVPSVKYHDNIISCGLSFLKCITMAKRLHLQSILICEDDVTFHSNSKQIWTQCLKQLPNNWDILLGGISNFENKNIGGKQYKNLVKLNDFSGEHMMLVNSKAYNKLFYYITQNKLKIKHFDRFLGSLAKRNFLNIYCCVPFVSIPIVNGYSDIRKQYVSDSHYFCSSIVKLKKLIIK